MKKVVYQGMSEIEIKARPEQVWSILEDSTHLSQWAPMVKSTTGKTERVGSVRSCEVEWEGRKDHVVERCIEAIPNKKIIWEMEQGMMRKMFSKIQFGFTMEPTDSTATMVRLEFLYEPRNILARIMYTFMMRRKLEGLRQSFLENLKGLIEKG